MANTQQVDDKVPVVSPIQVAFRGFKHAFTLDWVYGQLDAAIREGILERPVHDIGSGQLPIPIHFGLSLVETWKFHFDRGHRIDIPRVLWDEIDRMLGVS